MHHKLNEMGNWSEQQKAKEEVKERDKVTRETIAKYFLDLSKLVFTAIVLGGLTPIFTGTLSDTNWVIVSVGAISTVCLAIFGYRILKR